MPAESPADGAALRAEALAAAHAGVVEWLLAKSQGARWGLTRARFAQALECSASRRFDDARPAATELAAYLESLHVEDLALACACTDGSEPAWEYFVREYRAGLRAAARAMARGAGEARACELADSLFAELYGLGRGSSQAERRPLLSYYHGRSKLSTWLYAVLAQRYVDVLRAGQRNESLEGLDPTSLERTPRAKGAGAPPDTDRARLLPLLQAALREALATLAPRDRLRLACRYARQLTLAQTGRVLGEHEATASRNLERTCQGLRRQVERSLREKKLDQGQIELCFAYATEPWPFDLTGAISSPPQPADPGRNPREE